MSEALAVPYFPICVAVRISSPHQPNLPFRVLTSPRFSIFISDRVFGHVLLPSLSGWSPWIPSSAIPSAARVPVCLLTCPRCACWALTLYLSQSDASPATAIIWRIPWPAVSPAGPAPAKSLRIQPLPSTAATALRIACPAVRIQCMFLGTKTDGLCANLVLTCRVFFQAPPPGYQQAPPSQGYGQPRPVGGTHIPIPPHPCRHKQSRN